MAVTSPPSITALPDAPDPNNRTTFNALAYPWSVALDTFGTEVAALGANVYANATDAAASATSASASSTSAIAAANFKGAWSGLTGALAIPASVSHSGGLWLLLASVADVTAHTPGVSANWMRLGQVTMPRRAITSADTIVAGDFGGVIDVTSGTFSLAVTAVASLPSGFWTIVRNSSTAGVVTIDPNSSETIGGASTLILYPKQAALIYLSGSNLDYLSLEQPAIGVVSSAAASGSSVVLTPAALRNATYRIVIGQVTTSGAASIQLNGNNLCTSTSAESNFIIDAYFDSSGNAACVSHGEIGAGGERTVYVPLTSPTTLTVAPSSGTFSGGTITFIRLT